MNFSLGLDAAGWSAVRLSLEVGFLATLAVAPPGLALGWLLARKDFHGKAVVDALVHLPLVCTPVVTGYLLLLLFGRHGPLGAPLTAWGFPVAFAFPGAVLAAATVALPLMVRSARTAIDLVDPRLEQAAATLGAAPWRVFLRITLPLAWPGLLAGVVLSFARALGEFGATITLAGAISGETRTLPVAIHAALQSPDGDALAIRLTVASLVVSMAALLAADACDRHLRRRGGRS